MKIILLCILPAWALGADAQTRNTVEGPELRSFKELSKATNLLAKASDLPTFTEEELRLRLVDELFTLYHGGQNVPPHVMRFMEALAKNSPFSDPVYVTLRYESGDVWLDKYSESSLRFKVKPHITLYLKIQHQPANAPGKHGWDEVRIITVMRK